MTAPAGRLAGKVAVITGTGWLSRMADGRDERFDKLAWWRESDAMTRSRKRSTLSRQPRA